MQEDLGFEMITVQAGQQQGTTQGGRTLKGSWEQEGISRATGSSPGKEGWAVGAGTVPTRAPRHCFCSLQCPNPDFQD